MLMELGANERQIPGLGGMPRMAAPPAFKIRNILVPIYLFACSKKALRYATAFADQFGARISLLHVRQSEWFVPELAPLDLGGMGARARAEAAAKLLELATDEISDHIPADFLVRDGHPPIEIVTVAKELKADLIVISTHGYTGLKHAWHGSMTENVVRHSACPIFVAREEEKEFLS
jgi:universal stress protein A